jgi:subtilisin family serine protease
MFLIWMAAPLLRVAVERAAPVDGRIFRDVARGARTSFLVVLKDRADLSAAAGIPDRGERRRFVYETLRAKADSAQAPLRARLDRAGVTYRSHFLVDMIEVVGDAALAAELSERDDVKAIAADFPAVLSRAKPPTRQVAPRVVITDVVEPNVSKVRAPDLWSLGFEGQGVVVGVADTGFQWDHPALVARYRGSAASHDYAWHDAIHDAATGNPCGSDSPSPCDDDGHGTGTAGLAVGDAGPGNRIGVAPGATLIGCRNMDRGTGTPARYAECFEWMLAPTDSAGQNPRPDLGADVINDSWSCPPSEGCTDPDVLETVVNNVASAGIAVVFAAGNDGTEMAGVPECFTVDEPPAIYGSAITVGATWVDDVIASFSSIGPVALDGSNRLKPDLVAPGVALRTAAPSNAYAESFTGTSGAAPEVAGAIALLWSAMPEIAGDVDRTLQALELGATPLTLTQPLSCAGYSGADVPNPVFGWGRLDAKAALDRLVDVRSEPSLIGSPRTPRVVPTRP